MAPRTTRAESRVVDSEIRVWDPLVRVLHWTLVAAVAIAAATAEAHGKPAHTVHEISGYVALGVIALRILWGLAGPRHARFGSFVRPPGVAWDYSRALAGGVEPRHLGHNPLGGWMILALLGMGLLAAGSGWLYVTDRFWGAEWLEETHEALGHALYGLVGLHVAGALFTGWRHRENLVRAMVTGRKRAPGPGDIA